MSETLRYLKNRILMIKAALQCQDVDGAFRLNDFDHPSYDLRKKELALKRYYKYGGHREYINLYTPKDLKEAKYDLKMAEDGLCNVGFASQALTKAEECMK